MRDNRLWQILVAPQQASEQPTDNDWLEVEDQFGPLPTDFKTFLADYGTGCIGGFIWIFNPASNENLNLGRQIEKQLAALREVNVPGLTLFPADTGILPFGITDNGDLLAWRVHGEPNTWHVVVVDSRAPIFQVFEVGFSQFLAGILSRGIICSIFPDDFPPDHPAFTPI